MKYLFILLFSITSNLALASDHGGSENPSSGDDGGGYGGSSSAAGAIVACLLYTSVQPFSNSSSGLKS